MSFLYLNIGYGDMFDDSTFTTENSLLYNKRDGISFKNGSGKIKLPSTPKLLCGKLNVISETGAISGLSISIEANGMSKKFIIGFTSDNAFYQCNDLDSRYVLCDNIVTSAYGVNTLWFYIIPTSSSTDGMLQCVLNGKFLFNVNDSNIGFPNDCYIKISSTNSDLHLFNFIMADQQFDYSCEVVLCNSVITTEMEENDNGYIVTGDGQTLMHKLDVSDLINTYTKKANVLGMSLANVYNSGTPPCISLNSMEKKNNSYKTNETFYIESESGYVQSSMFLTNLTLNNMKNRIYGWSVKG